MEISELYKIYLQFPHIQTDTRKLKTNELFFALSGPLFNGNTFAHQAIENGASYAIIDQPEFYKSEQYIVVPNVLFALQQLAKYHRQQLHIPVLAITGSNGKTTTKELITVVLKKKYKTYATEGNLNNHIGVPLTLLKIPVDCEIAIIEMGANHLNEIASYCEIALPNYGLITNCGKAHLEGFGSEENIIKGKGELFDFIKKQENGTIFINTDLAYLHEMGKGIAQQVTYGRKNATYLGSPIPTGIQLQVNININDNINIIKTQLVGNYNFPNVMAAVAVGLFFKVTFIDIKHAIENYIPENSRSQFLEKGTNKIILDAYNANPSSMNEAIQNFANNTLLNKILWIGGMKEMGNAELAEHMALVELIDKYQWHEVILVGKEFLGISKKHLYFENSVDALAYVKLHLPINSAILIKGSRGNKMELLLNAL